MTTPERQLEDQFIEKLQGLKYEYRADIRDRAALEKNFRDKFESLNHVHLTDGEFQRLLEEIVTPDVFTAAHTLRNRSSFTRDDGTPLNYTLVNIVDWCKNTFEVVSQLRINTDYKGMTGKGMRRRGLGHSSAAADCRGRCPRYGARSMVFNALSRGATRT
jgi:type I restriction enzyme, R subunit